MPDDDDQAGSGLLDLQFKQAFLARHGLPDIAYPVRPNVLDAVISGDGEPPFAELLYGLQLRSSEAPSEWQGWEPALDRLAELIAPDDPRPAIAAGGDTWWLEIGPVDLGAPVITIQRRDQLIAAIARRVIPGVWVRPYGQEDGQADDHLHIDLGYTVFDPVEVQDGSPAPEAEAEAS